MRGSSFILLGLTLVPAVAQARSFRQGQIPNGGSYTCDSCHGKTSLLEQDLTPFGMDVNRTLSNNNVVWSAIWNLDSDGDGFSNGLELGDPGGTWRTGQPNPDEPTANPGIPNDGICGNGVAEPDEDCDSSDYRSQTCQSLGFGEGTLSCHSLCRWVTAECGFCGDGYLNPNFEDCDRDAFPSDLTCEDFGFLRGDLSCSSDCEVDPSTCTDEAPAVCGDGVISTGELCDGDNLGTVDCIRIAYAGGTLVCTDECKWDASNCIFEDGRRVGDEERAAEDDGSTGLEDAGGTPTGGTNGGPSGSDAGPGGPRPGPDAGSGIDGSGKACTTALGRPPFPSWLSLVLLGFVVRRRKRGRKRRPDQQPLVRF